MSSFIGLINNPPWDLALFLTLAAGAFFWGASYGKRSIGFVIVNIYILLALWEFIPVEALVAGRALIEIWAIKAAIFTLLLILLLLFMSRAFGRGGNEGVWWEVLILSILGAGFFMSVLISFAPPDAIKKNILFLNKLTLDIFAAPLIVRWWMILPILGVLFV